MKVIALVPHLPAATHTLETITIIYIHVMAHCLEQKDTQLMS